MNCFDDTELRKIYDNVMSNFIRWLNDEYLNTIFGPDK